MFKANDKNNKNDGVKILLGETTRKHSRVIIADIVARGSKYPQTKIVTTKKEVVENEPIVLSEESNERYEQPQSDLQWRKTKRNGKLILKPFVLSSILSLVILTVAVWSISTYFSKFTVAIMPKTELVDIGEIAVLVDTKSVRPNFASNVVPGEMLELTKSEEAEFKSTGQKNIEDKARGAIKIYNSFSSSPQKLVATTRFVDESGKIFKLLKTVTVPGAIIENGGIKPSFIEVEAEAGEAGEEYNTGPSRFKILGFVGTQKYDTFYGESGKGFSGGYRGVATVISDEDIKKATESLTAKLFNDLKNEITKKIPQGLRLLEPFKEIVIEQVKTPKKNSMQETFKIEARGRARAIVFRDKDVEDLAKNFVLADKPDKDFIEGSFAPIFKRREVKFEKRSAQFVVAGNAKLRSRVEAEKIQAFILGKKFGTIEEFLKKNSAIASFQFKSFPFWNLKAPSSLQKINISVK